MEIERAFQILGLRVGSSEDEIRGAYRERSKSTHPDAVGGDTEKQKELNEAYQRAKAYSKIEDAVVPFSSKALAKNLRVAIAPYISNVAAEKARTIHRQRTRSIQKLKWISWAFGLVTAAMVLFAENASRLPGIPSDQIEELTKLWAPVSLSFGLIGLLLQFIVTWNERRIEDFLDLISEKRECAKQLAERLGYEDLTSFKWQDLRSDWPESPTPLPPVPWVSSLGDLTPVLIAKAVEHGLVVPEEVPELTPYWDPIYSLQFNPALFKPAPPAPATPPKPRTAAEIRSEIGCFSGALVVMCGAAFGVALVWKSLWAVVPALFALGAASIVVESFRELRKVRRAANSGTAPDS